MLGQRAVIIVGGGARRLLVCQGAGARPGAAARGRNDIGRAAVRGAPWPSAIDRAAAAVTVRNIRGEDAVMTLPDSGALDGVAVGDVIDIAYTAALAITVHRDASRPSPRWVSRGPP